MGASLGPRPPLLSAQAAVRLRPDLGIPESGRGPRVAWVTAGSSPCRAPLPRSSPPWQMRDRRLPARPHPHPAGSWGHQLRVRGQPPVLRWVGSSHWGLPCPALPGPLHLDRPGFQECRERRKRPRTPLAHRGKRHAPPQTHAGCTHAPVQPLRCHPRRAPPPAPPPTLKEVPRGGWVKGESGRPPRGTEPAGGEVPGDHAPALWKGSRKRDVGRGLHFPADVGGRGAAGTTGAGLAAGAGGQGFSKVALGAGTRDGENEGPRVRVPLGESRGAVSQRLRVPAPGRRGFVEVEGGDGVGVVSVPGGGPATRGGAGSSRSGTPRGALRVGPGSPAGRRGRQVPAGSYSRPG